MNLASGNCTNSAASICHSKKKDGSDHTVASRGPLCCRQETALDFHAEGLTKVHADEQTLEDAPRIAGAELRHSGRCQRNRREPDTQCATCDTGHQRRETSRHTLDTFC